jgi:hypothetical protein
MKRSLPWIFLFVAIPVSSMYRVGLAEAEMPLPSGQQGFSYSAIHTPVVSDDPSGAKPVSVGSLVTGGDTLGLQIHLAALSDHADVYVAIHASGITPELLMLTSDNELRPVSKVGLVPWKVDTTGPVQDAPLGDIPVSLLPSGSYQIYLLVTPAGSLATCYLWTTSFTHPAVADYTGTFYVTLSGQPRSILDIHEQGDILTFSLEGDFVLQGSGSRSGNTLTLQAEMPELSNTINISVTFSDDRQSFAGQWNMSVGNVEGSITGTRSAWPVYDVDASGLPQFVSANVIELSKISQISKFRSGQGHDYSDDFEFCRSMKHYFLPKPDVDRLTIQIFSPFDGTVISTSEEWSDDLVWKGTMLGIRSNEYPAFHVIIFHIDLAGALGVGDSVRAGQLLGTPPEYERGTIADTALGVSTPGGYRLLSYFDVMTDSLFEEYQARGVNSRNDAIIAREARDADPLACEGQQFLHRGTLENWVYLN